MIDASPWCEETRWSHLTLYTKDIWELAAGQAKKIELMAKKSYIVGNVSVKLKINGKEEVYTLWWNQYKLILMMMIVNMIICWNTLQHTYNIIFLILHVYTSPSQSPSLSISFSLSWSFECSNSIMEEPLWENMLYFANTSHY